MTNYEPSPLRAVMFFVAGTAMMVVRLLEYPDFSWIDFASMAAGLMFILLSIQEFRKIRAKKKGEG